MPHPPFENTQQTWDLNHVPTNLYIFGCDQGRDSRLSHRAHESVSRTRGLRKDQDFHDCIHGQVGAGEQDVSRSF